MPTATRTRRKAAVPTYELNQFTWVRDKRLLVIEASDLQMQSIPQRFNIHSPKTDRVEGFTYSMPVKDLEGETTSWYFVADSAECPIRMVIIFND